MTYGLPDLSKDAVLITKNSDVIYIMGDGQIVDSTVIGNKITYDKATYPNIIKNRRYIDGCGFSCTVMSDKSVYLAFIYMERQ